MHHTGILFFSLLLGFILPLGTLAAEKTVRLPVPFTVQIPNGSWTGPWRGACEEASIVMVDRYYHNEHGKISKSLAMKLLSPLFTLENKWFGSNFDTSATRTAKIINNALFFNETIVHHPTLEAIKAELQAGRPVISLHYGRNLINPNVHYRTGGAAYHMIVIIGYDDTTGTFITNDPGDTISGNGHRYPYENYLDSLGDFNHTTQRVDTTLPTVIFTAPKLARAKDSSAIYYIEDGTKHYIAHPRVFKEKKWQWNAVFTVDSAWLDGLTTGTMFTPQT